MSHRTIAWMICFSRSFKAIPPILVFAYISLTFLVIPYSLVHLLSPAAVDRSADIFLLFEFSHFLIVFFLFRYVLGAGAMAVWVPPRWHAPLTALDRHSHPSLNHTKDSPIQKEDDRYGRDHSKIKTIWHNHSSAGCLSHSTVWSELHQG